MIDLKKQAAQRALEFVDSGMIIGLGTGSTASVFIDLLAQRIHSGGLQGIQGVPTSKFTADQARRLGIPLTSLAEHEYLHLAVDGADEVDPGMNLIKGLGKALLREKLIEIHARRFVVIVDESKLVNRLGQHVPLPVEIVRFEWQASIRWLNSLGCRAELWNRDDGHPNITDNGNYLARCWFEDQSTGRMVGIPDPCQLADQLAARPGIVEHGLFLNMATDIIVARSAEVIRMGKDL
jgi:ribose 5-phosphate isomerase A